ncbi:MAG: nucleotidyltransferase [Candidatus Electrothrix sp. LOE1_4_5]|jgi:nucleotidyltransferase substrate binding protein (TIGR01987 family)|nr:nucleotidyltransferase [Candidatus Electrothrix gigas]MCI5128670.1 nucleotidyltransferase [Candidatus Electrothrix gigas]
MTQDIRWKQRFSNYQKALRQLQKFIDKGELSELEEQGLIKSFEYTYELAWNTLKDFLEFQGHSDIFGSRDALRKAFQVGIIEDGEVWMDMIKSRNRTSHTYNEETANEISRTIISLYYNAFQKMNDRLDIFKNDDQ